MKVVCQLSRDIETCIIVISQQLQAPPQQLEKAPSPKQTTAEVTTDRTIIWTTDDDHPRSGSKTPPLKHVDELLNEPSPHSTRMRSALRLEDADVIQVEADVEARRQHIQTLVGSVDSKGH